MPQEDRETLHQELSDADKEVHEDHSQEEARKKFEQLYSNEGSAGSTDSTTSTTSAGASDTTTSGGD